MGWHTDRGGGVRETTQWTRAVAWGDQAVKIAADFDKGSAVSLAGSLRVNSYEKDGAKNRVLELHVDSATPSSDPNISRNDAALIGVVRSIEPKTLEKGSLTVVSLATTTKQNNKDREDWHSVAMWGRTGEAARKEIGVGDTVAIDGSVQHRSVEGPAFGRSRRMPDSSRLLGWPGLTISLPCRSSVASLIATDYPRRELPPPSEKRCVA